MRSWDSRKASAGGGDKTAVGRNRARWASRWSVGVRRSSRPAPRRGRGRRRTVVPDPNPVVALPWGSGRSRGCRHRGRPGAGRAVERDRGLADPTLADDRNDWHGGHGGGRLSCMWRPRPVTVDQAVMRRTSTMSSSAPTRWGLASNRARASGHAHGSQRPSREPGPNPCRGDAAMAPSTLGSAAATPCLPWSQCPSRGSRGDRDEVESVAQCFGSDPRVAHLVAPPRASWITPGRTTVVPKHPSETPARGVGPMVRNAVRGVVDSRAKRAIYRAKRAASRTKRALPFA